VNFGKNWPKLGKNAKKIRKYDTLTQLSKNRRNKIPPTSILQKMTSMKLTKSSTQKIPYDFFLASLSVETQEFFQK